MSYFTTVINTVYSTKYLCSILPQYPTDNGQPIVITKTQIVSVQSLYEEDFSAFAPNNSVRACGNRRTERQVVRVFVEYGSLVGLHGLFTWHYNSLQSLDETVRFLLVYLCSIKHYKHMIVL